MIITYNNVWLSTTTVEIWLKRTLFLTNGKQPYVRLVARARAVRVGEYAKIAITTVGPKL